MPAGVPTINDGYKGPQPRIWAPMEMGKLPHGVWAADGDGWAPGAEALSGFRSWNAPQSKRACG